MRFSPTNPLTTIQLSNTGNAPADCWRIWQINLRVASRPISYTGRATTVRDGVFNSVLGKSSYIRNEIDRGHYPVIYQSLVDAHQALDVLQLIKSLHRQTRVSIAWMASF